MIHKIKPSKFKPLFETVGCFCEYKGEILLLKRLPEKPEGDKWGLPAGKIDQGENLIGAMLRELEEETGHRVSAQDLQFLSTVFVRYPDYDFVFHSFKLPLDEKIKILISPKESTAFRWERPEEALKMNIVENLDQIIMLHYLSK